MNYIGAKKRLENQRPKPSTATTGERYMSYEGKLKLENLKLRVKLKELKESMQPQEAHKAFTDLKIAGLYKDKETNAQVQIIAITLDYDIPKHRRVVFNSAVAKNIYFSLGETEFVERFDKCN